MSEPKWTMGPWFVHDFTGLDEINGQVPYPSSVSVSCDHPAHITVAQMGNAMSGTLDEARANARLIAAAPSMAEYIKKRMDAGDGEAAVLWRLANGAG